MIQKGEIPWSEALKPEYKNKKNFFVHTVLFYLLYLLLQSLKKKLYSCSWKWQFFFWIFSRIEHIILMILMEIQRNGLKQLTKCWIIQFVKDQC